MSQPRSLSQFYSFYFFLSIFIFIYQRKEGQRGRGGTREGGWMENYFQKGKAGNGDRRII